MDSSEEQLLTDEIIEKVSNKIIAARSHIMLNNSFYGLMLMKLDYEVDAKCKNIAASVNTIVFNPQFVLRISDDELEFYLKHEILHIVLQHVLRGKDKDIELFNRAADIVVNSIILRDEGLDHFYITNERGSLVEVSHLAPDGKEGCEYDVEQVYDMLISKGSCRSCKSSENTNSNSDEDESDPDGKSGKDEQKNKGEDSTDNDGTDSSEGSDEIDNSDDDGLSAIDDHSMWGEDNSPGASNKLFMMLKSTEDALDYNEEFGNDGWGGPPEYIERVLDEFIHPETDWRVILQDFIQEEICDYSFNPPDRRFQDSPFLLPDYNDTDAAIKDILIMVDTSGSMSDEILTRIISEIINALEQFHDKFNGWLGFFDTEVKGEPQRFESLDDIKHIKPEGGGGNENYIFIFKYVAEEMGYNPPSCIIIATDGYCDFPTEDEVRDVIDIPVLWLITDAGYGSRAPDWGKVAKISVADEK